MDRYNIMSKLKDLEESIGKEQAEKITEKKSKESNGPSIEAEAVLIPRFLSPLYRTGHSTLG